MEPRGVEIGPAQSRANPPAWQPPVRNLQLRQPSKPPGSGLRPEHDPGDQEARQPEEEAYIICRQCRQAVTRSQERCSIQGAHLHTFANPHGLVFEIGCFKSAVGCGYAGEASDEFTWFRGYRWRVCFCSTCLSHLGWLFSASGRDGFHGLILERLIEPD